MAAASVFVMNLKRDSFDAQTEAMLSHINVGFGLDITIRELAELIGKVIAYEGKIAFDPKKPDGTPQKLMDSQRLNSMGWRAAVKLEEGLQAAYKDFLNNGTTLSK